VLNRRGSQRFTCRTFESVTILSAEVGSNASPLSRASAATFTAVEFSVPVFARVVVIAAGEFDEYARLIAHRPRIVTRW
jgi:hypothetical protein